MVSFIELFSSRLPVVTYFEEKFKEKYQIEQFTGHWNETYYVYIFVMSLVHISLLIYTFYLLYTCLRVKKTQGAGTTFVNGFCDVLFACFCMPCYIVYRGFLNPCKVLADEIHSHSDSLYGNMLCYSPFIHVPIIPSFVVEVK